MSSLREIFANNLRRMRVARGLSQDELAALAGLHRTYVGSVERGERNITLESIERLAGALEVNPVVMLCQEMK